MNLFKNIFKWKAVFMIDPSFEKWICVSVAWLQNEQWASLIIINDWNDYVLSNIIQLFKKLQQI